MVDQRLKDLRGSGRRDFLRWSATVAAVLGLERARFLNVINDAGGTALADSASCTATNKSIALIDGNGGFANWNLIFPHVAIATGTDPNYSFHALGKATMAAGTDKPLAYAPESPFQKLGAKKQISAFMAGNNETHTGTPTSASTVSAGVNMIAAMAAIQTATPTLLPVIGVGTNAANFGAAAGAPAVATVTNAAGMVGLFDSAASKALLSTPANSSLHEAYYKAFLGLNAAAGRSTITKGYNVGKVAANLLGQNLSNQLRPTTAEQTALGLTAGTATAIANIGNSLITAAKAFKLGLTSMVMISGLRNDPHGLFGGGDAAAQAVAASLGKILDGFMAMMAASASPTCASKTLADEIIMTIHGDTPKTPRDRNGWGDGTPNNSNWLYVYGNGYTKTGWFGGVDANAVRGFDPATGNDVANQASSVTANAAGAAALYAVAKGDMRRVQDFYRGATIAGITNPAIL